MLILKWLPKKNSSHNPTADQFQADKQAMKFYIETDRLILRDFLESDVEGMYELDSNPEVHRYLGNNPIKEINQIPPIIQFVRQQYEENGIGRWAVIEKKTNGFIGWSGLKLVKETRNQQSNYYDVGYRLIQKYWGQGYATESAQASLNYGFGKMNLETICAAAQAENIASNKVLQKCGLKLINQYFENEVLENWYQITQAQWLNRIP